MFGAEVEGEHELAQAWGSAANIVRDGTAQAVIRGIREGVAEARTKHTFHNQTGNLEKSIEGNATGWRGDRFEGVMRATARYASYVEEGTPPHTITGNPMLTFQWKGVLVRFRYVNHPGTKPMPFMGIAYIKAERVIISRIELGIERAQNRLDR